MLIYPHDKHHNNDKVLWQSNNAGKMFGLGTNSGRFVSSDIFLCIHLSECHTVTKCTLHLPLIALFIQWEISQNSGSFFRPFTIYHWKWVYTYPSFLREKYIFLLMVFFSGWIFFRYFVSVLVISSLLMFTFLDLNFFSSSFAVIGFLIKYRRIASSVIPALQRNIWNWYQFLSDFQKVTYINNLLEVT